MEALIILHGLFLLSCNQSSHQCRIMIADTPPHKYTVGVNADLGPIPPSKTMTTTLSASVRSNPFGDGTFSDRQLVLDSKTVASDPTGALSIISIPMPDGIYGANRVQTFREDLLNKTSGTILVSGNGGQGSVIVAETVVLSFLNRSAFSLIDGKTTIKTSETLKQMAVLCLYSGRRAPVRTGTIRRILIAC